MMLQDSLFSPAIRRSSIALELWSVLDRLVLRKAAAGSVRYDDRCRGGLGLKASQAPVPYSCVTPRTGGGLRQTEIKAQATGHVLGGTDGFLQRGTHSKA